MKGLMAQNTNIEYKKDSLLPINKWTLKAGFNLIDNDGAIRSFHTLGSLKEAAFSGVPVRLGLEYRFSKVFSFELAGSLNKWKAGEGVLDGTLLTEDQNYSSADVFIKLYVDEVLNWFRGADWFEPYLAVGAGYFDINEGGTTFNFGPGVNFWFSEFVGFNFEAVGKWALDNNPALFDSNHVQYSFGLTFRFKDEDNDNDGIYNYNDYCPNIPGSRESNGCPDDGTVSVRKKLLDPDTDGDGVLDKDDQCVNIAGSPSNNGCPLPDSDGDGVVDIADNCPNIVGSPNNNGCPFPDSDDGVVDTADNCPNIVGLPENGGCPKKTFEQIKEALVTLTKGIKFDTGNYNFKQEAYPVLQSIVSLMKENTGNVTYSIEGHTDSVGSYESNRILSRNRANAVRNYFIDNGIPRDKLKTVGHGESRPMDTNLNKVGRANNRRVEIIQIKTN